MSESMATPKRIQRKRVKGWKMPEGAIYVGRGTRWGNPFRVGQPVTYPAFRNVMVDGAPLTRQGVVENRAHAVELFAFWLRFEVPYTQADIRRELGGKDLACWCPAGESCHADVLLEAAREVSADA